MSGGHVELHIEELVLRGFPSEARHRIGDAVERELTRLLAGRGAETNGPPDRGRVPWLDSGDFPADLHAEEVGRRIAKRIYGATYGPSTRGGIQDGGE